MKCLIVAPSWIGDLVISQSLFLKLRDLYPDSVIDVLAPSWCQPLLTLMPEVNQSMILPFDHGELNLLGRWKMGRELRKNRYDWAIVLPNSWKSTLVPFFASISRRTGYLGETRYGLLNDIHKLDKDRYPSLAQRFVALVTDQNQDLPQPKLVIKANILMESLASVSQKMSIDLDHFCENQYNIIALCPGAEYGPAKRWPESYYAELAQSLLEKGFAVWVFGSKKDQPITDWITQQVRHPHFLNFAGQTSLLEATSLLSLTHKVITNDSGLMHVAAALGKKVIALYGSTDPTYTPPLSDKAQILTTDLACRPCFKRECPFAHYNCLKQITPAQVLNLCLV